MIKVDNINIYIIFYNMEGENYSNIKRKDYNISSEEIFDPIIERLSD